MKILMRLHTTRWAAVLTLIAALTLSACNKKESGGPPTARAPEAPPSTTPPADGVRRISITELRDMLEKGEAVLVDVRGGVDYRLGHIKGALSIPLGLIREHAQELPRDKLIVTYCA